MQRVLMFFHDDPHYNLESTLEFRLIPQYILHHFRLILRFKGWRSSGNHHVANDASSPNITFLIIFLINNFRRKITRRTDSIGQILVMIQSYGQSKINDLDRLGPFFLKQHIFRFEIPMNDVLLMQVNECPENLPHILFYWKFGDFFISEFRW